MTLDPLRAPAFAHMDEEHPRHVAHFLAEVLRSPTRYTEQRGGHATMLAHHLRKHRTAAQRTRWVALPLECADEVALPDDPEFRSAFVSYLEWGSRLALLNSQDGAAPALEQPMPRRGWGEAGGPYTGRPGRSRRPSGARLARGRSRREDACGTNRADAVGGELRPRPEDRPMMPNVPRQLTADHAPLRRAWGARTLADLDAGEQVEVHAVAPAMRDVLADLGVREGQRVRCEAVHPYLIVRTPEGRVPLDRGVASAVHVSSPIVERDDARTA